MVLFSKCLTIQNRLLEPNCLETAATASATSPSGTHWHPTRSWDAPSALLLGSSGPVITCLYFVGFFTLFSRELVLAQKKGCWGLFVCSVDKRREAVRNRTKLPCSPSFPTPLDFIICIWAHEATSIWMKKLILWQLEWSLITGCGGTYL